MSGAVADAVWLVRGTWVSMIVRAGCELGLFDALDQPRTAAFVAATVGTDPGATARFLRVLIDLGLVEQVDDRYALTDVGATLRADHPARIRDLVLMQTDLTVVAAWHELADGLRTGAGTYEPVNGVSHWQHLAAHPEQERIFNGAMARRGRTQAEAILASGHLDGTSSLVDVGGGRGAMLAALLAERPRLTGVVADRPPVAAEAETSFASAGLGDRARAVPCDFFVGVPEGGDVYVIANVLHDWSDDDAVSILRTVRAAMVDDARLLVVEHVLDAPGRSSHEQRDVHLVDLHMLVVFGARERTQAEYDSLLHRAGFTASRLARPAGEWNVLEASPAAGETAE